MGCIPLSLDLLLRHIPQVGGLGTGLRMVELGNQQMYAHMGIAEGSPAKTYFQNHGVEHVSIDLNGLLGALILDLSVPINRWKGYFDIVTDFGTSEHVGPDLTHLYYCRANCHDFCRLGGLFIFINPMTGHWPQHGYHYFTLNHYWNWALAQGYQVLELTSGPCLGNYIDSWQIFAALLKVEDKPFLPLADYMALCAGTVFTK